jgi:nucleotide-binding universal stress UspA family protein
LNAPENALLARARKHVEQSLHQLAEHCSQAGVEYHQVQEIGMPHEQILVEGQRHDVILLGNETKPDAGLGVPPRSILENVLRHSPRPVVAVPASPENKRGILVAYDGSLQAARAVQALVASGLPDLGSIRVLSVDRESEETANQHAGRAVEYLAAHDIDARHQPEVTEEPVERVIVDQAQRHNVELIVMGAYGRSRLAEFFLGSVTSHVIDESPIPLFLFH